MGPLFSPPLSFSFVRSQTTPPLLNSSSLSLFSHVYLQNPSRMWPHLRWSRCQLNTLGLHRRPSSVSYSPSGIEILRWSQPFTLLLPEKSICHRTQIQTSILGFVLLITPVWFIGVNTTTTAMYILLSHLSLLPSIGVNTSSPPFNLNRRKPLAPMNHRNIVHHCTASNR